MAEKKRVEDEARQKAAAEAADKKRQEDEARQKAETDAAAKRKAEEDEKKATEATENALRLTVPDRQHVQVALSALGFNTNGTDGAFGARTREMIAAWQKARDNPPTGFLTGAQNQALLKEAAPAIARFDDEQKKNEETKKKADEEKAKAEAAVRAAPPPTAQAPQVAAAAPPPTAGAPKAGTDGAWHGTYTCTPSKHGGAFTIQLQMTVNGGAGSWVRPGSGPGTTGNQSVSIRISGSQVTVARVFSPQNQVGVFSTGTMVARYDGNNTIAGSGPEQNSGGRNCDLSLMKVR
jgi:peptidoglycan hydrolase-like protein with peptidoglycan-binding domain